MTAKELEAARAFFRPHIPRFAAFIEQHSPDALVELHCAVREGHTNVGEMKGIGSRWVKLTKPEKEKYKYVVKLAAWRSMLHGPKWSVYTLSNGFGERDLEGMMMHKQHLDKIDQAKTFFAPHIPRFMHLILRSSSYLLPKLHDGVRENKITVAQVKRIGARFVALGPEQWRMVRGALFRAGVLETEPGEILRSLEQSLAETRKR